MKICKKTIIILLTLIILLYSIIPPKNVYAEEVSGLTQDRAGEVLATFAIDFYNRYGTQTKYSGGDTCYSDRQQAYNGNMVNEKYRMDCVGWVNFAVHHSLNMNTGDGGYATGFAIPPNNNTTGFYSGFECAYGNEYGGSTISKDKIVEIAKPGDILVRDSANNGKHVLLYVGNGMVVHCDGHGPNGSGLSYQSIYDLGYEFCAIGRISANAAANIRNIKETWDGLPPVGGGVIIPSTTPKVDDSAAFNRYIDRNYIGQVDINGRNNSSSFYYNGIPKNGEYLGKTKDSWLFNTVNDALDWLLGIITLNIKIQVVGWTSKFDEWTNELLEAVTNTETLTERITVEDVIYNRVPILDVNMFNFSEAGGQPLETEDQKAEDNIIYILRQKIASWYVVIRTISIIILLFTLIYLGIRTAISSVASEKAEYKQKLVSWVVSFMIVMFIHYYMVAILQINETAVGWVTPPADSSASIYEQMRAYAYEIPATKGWTGAIIYVFLVYYLIKLLFFYFKRVLIVYILAIISPALGIAYSIQKINGKSKALGMWAKEFAFNVLIQFIHALIYTLMMGVILKVISNAKAIEIIPYTIILFALLNFILKAEDIIKNIFKIESNSLKSVIATALNLKNRFAGAIAVGSFALGLGKKAVGNAYDKHLTKSLDKKYDKYKVQGDDDFSQSINSEIDKLKEQEKAHTKELNSMAINFAKNQFVGTLALVAGVPVAFEKPEVGVPALIYGASRLNSQGINPGKYSSEARALASSTNAKGYKYIDDPNTVIETEGAETATNQTNNNGNNTASPTETVILNNPTQNNGTTTNTKSTEATKTRNGETITRVTENGTTQTTEQGRTIRKYNTKKNKTYRIPRTVLSWVTVGRSEQIGRVIKTTIDENKLIRTVYKTRIEKLSSMSKIITKDVTTLNNELDKIKTSNYPPVYYMPKPEENSAQVAINERLREKYREILEKNIIQIYEGVDEEKISEHVFFYKTDKVTLKSIEEIAKEYLAENKCEIGEKFSENLNDALREKVIDTVDAKNNGFERIKLKPELEKKIQDAIEGNRKKEDKPKLKTEVDKLVTENVKEEIVEKLSLKDLTDLISKTLEKKGSVEMNKDFKPLQETLEHLSLINQETKETVGKEMYSTEQILDFIMNKDITD